ISNFVVQALKGEALTVYGDGQQTRSFCYVSDLIDGIVRLLTVEEGSEDIHLPTNIGNPAEFTVAQLAHMVIAMTGSKSIIDYQPLPVDDPRVRQPDISRARNILGWEPRVSLAEGLQKTIDFFASDI